MIIICHTYHIHQKQIFIHHLPQEGSEKILVFSRQSRKRHKVIIETNNHFLYVHFSFVDSDYLALLLWDPLIENLSKKSKLSKGSISWHPLNYLLCFMILARRLLIIEIRSVRFRYFRSRSSSKRSKPSRIPL